MIIFTYAMYNYKNERGANMGWCNINICWLKGYIAGRDGVTAPIFK